ncbi:MAG: GumC family protein [Hormoscilla sp.]
MQAGTTPKVSQRNGHKPTNLSLYQTQILEKNEEFDPKQILNILRRRGLVLVGVAAVVTGGIGWWTWTRPPVYQANFRMLVEPISEDNTSRNLLRLGFPPGFDYATQIEVLRSPKQLESVVSALQETYPEISYGELASNLSIAQGEDAVGRLTKILNISYEDSDPQKIKLVLDKLLERYVEYGIELRQQNLKRVVEFVEQQLPILEERVDSLQIELEEFRKRYSLIDPETRGNSISGLLAAIQQQQKEAQTQLAETQSLYVILQRQLGSSPAEAFAASALSESGRYQSLLNQLLQIETEIAAESVRFQPDSPNIEVLLEKRSRLLPLINRESERILGSQQSSSTTGNLAPISIELSKQLVQTTNQLQVLQVRLGALEQVEKSLKEEFSLIPSLARQYTDLQRRLEVANNSLDRFLATRETLQIEAAQKAISWQVISEPFLPTGAISPNIPRGIALGAIAGLLLGIGAALLSEQLDNAFHSPNEIKELTGLPLLGTIPFKRRLKQFTKSLGSVDRAASHSGEIGNGSVITRSVVQQTRLTNVNRKHNYGSSPFLEAFRTLYTNIRFLSSDSPIRSLVISSCLPAEGKSTVALFLARSAAAMGQRVLLVDSDMRNPQIHDRMGLPNMRGLSNVITTEIDPNEVIQRSPFDENLFVLTAGQIPPDPIKILSSRKMQNLVEQFQNAFDLTIYDTPPSLGLADGSILATRADGMVLVVGMEKTGRSELNQVLDNLKISYVSVLGMIANGVKGQTSGADYYYRYYSPNR